MFFWNTNSALFEVAMCVMCYLTVLYIEFFPIVAERFKGKVNLKGFLSGYNNLINKLLTVLDGIVGKFMWVFIIAGVVLSCMHQSSLGTLMLLAPTKLHPLWYTPILPLLFLTSAISLGYPMVVFETTIITSSLKLDSEMDILTPLTRITIFLLGLYGLLKFGDMFVRGTYVYLLDGTFQTNSFLAEILFGVIIPWLMLLSNKIRSSRRGLFIASTLIVSGVVLNRLNVFIVGYISPVSKSLYFPAVGEIAVTVGLIATLMFVYRLAVTWLPVLNVQVKEASDEK
jgi:Ni/Fe-hydrogenase subunit HybB-like protein